MKRRFFIIFTLVISSVFSCNTGENSKPKENSNLMLEAQKTEDEWKKILTPEEYRVLRQKGTEYPGTGEYNLFFEDGEYKCRACGNKLFDSDTKFESHCGWPSFYDVSKSDAIREIPDSSYGMIRTEVVCAKCGGHLGHVFEDGPNPTGLRYCINSVSIKFSKKENK